MAPRSITSGEEIDKTGPRSRQQHIILRTIPPLSLRTPTHSIRLQLSYHSPPPDKHRTTTMNDASIIETRSFHSFGRQTPSSNEDSGGTRPSTAQSTFITRSDLEESVQKITLAASETSQQVAALSARLDAHIAESKSQVAESKSQAAEIKKRMDATDERLAAIQEQIHKQGEALLKEIQKQNEAFKAAKDEMAASANLDAAEFRNGMQDLLFALTARDPQRALKALLTAGGTPPAFAHIQFESDDDVSLSDDLVDTPAQNDQQPLPPPALVVDIPAAQTEPSSNSPATSPPSASTCQSRTSPSHDASGTGRSRTRSLRSLGRKLSMAALKRGVGIILSRSSENVRDARAMLGQLDAYEAGKGRADEQEGEVPPVPPLPAGNQAQQPVAGPSSQRLTQAQQQALLGRRIQPDQK
ncbi:hypothetical protein C8Q77DRAFT_191131 [Trametes polyzona]|nr:hypothetical protein C8Q77DRAFT_191131 [Trametes polyzona]